MLSANEKEGKNTLNDYSCSHATIIFLLLLVTADAPTATRLTSINKPKNCCFVFAI